MPGVIGHLTQQRIVLHAAGVYSFLVGRSASIDGIDTSALLSGSQAFSDDTGDSYDYDATSVLAPVPNVIISPLVGLGRWILNASGGGASGPAAGDLAGTYPAPSVAAITETNGPTRLQVGAILANELLQRVGTALVGLASITDALHGALSGGSLHAAATGSTAGFMDAASYGQVWGTDGADVSVTTGAGFVLLQTTAAVLTVKNTLVRVGFEVSHNELLATKVPGAGSVSVVVAWLDDNSLWVQSLATGFTQVGATPTLTGTLISGVGWQLVFNANHTVSLWLAQDAIIARSARARNWHGSVVTMVNP
jgi:hypothetical protein